MPRMDGTGPMGQGAMTGGGRGVCAGTKTMSFGHGCTNCRGFGRGLGICRTMRTGSRDLLAAEKEALQNRLAFVEKQLQEVK